MNPNWRLEAAAGAFAVKRIVDVPLEKARRNLATPGALAAAGLPACAPLSTGEGESVVEAAFGRGYCAFPWVDGTHVGGWRLAVAEARGFGELVGRLHRGLAAAAAALGWAPVPGAHRAPHRTEVGRRENGSCGSRASGC